MTINEAIGAFLIFTGSLFYVLSSLGLIRMPDVYNRMQTATKSATLASLGVMIGVGIYSPCCFPKALVIALFLLLTNPISAHVLIRAAYRSEIPLWEGSIVDKYKEALKEEGEQ